MERTKRHTKDPETSSNNASAVRAVIAWLVETDREFRVTQSMVNDTHNRF